jgi:GTPase SAR1 family protein
MEDRKINITGYSPLQTPDLKVMVVGPRAGKTTWLNSVGQFRTRRQSTETLGVEITVVESRVHNRKVRLNMWEIGSKYSGLREKYCNGAHLGIIFKDDSNAHELYDAWIPNVPKIYVKNYTADQNETIMQALAALITTNSR